MRTTQAQAASQIRKELKKNGIKASVTSSSSPMTTNVDVYLGKRYIPSVVAKIEEFCNKYQMGSFNGQIDCYEYSNKNENLPQVRYVSVSNDYASRY